MKVKVRNMTSQGGKPVPNQFVLTTDEGEFFQSYETVIAFKPRSGKIQLNKKAWNYSATTGKYRNQFLGETKRETEAKIANGEYELVNLN